MLIIKSDWKEKNLTDKNFTSFILLNVEWSSVCFHENIMSLKEYSALGWTVEVSAYLEDFIVIQELNFFSSLLIDIYIAVPVHLSFTEKADFPCIMYNFFKANLWYHVSHGFFFRSFFKTKCTDQIVFSCLLV